MKSSSICVHLRHLRISLFASPASPQCCDQLLRVRVTLRSKVAEGSPRSLRGRSWARNGWQRFGQPTLPAGPASALPDAALFTLLTVLVWGLLAPLRGFWQDDTLHFSVVFGRRGNLPAALVQSFGTPMRRLYLLPYWLALGTPRPILTLQLLHGVFWVLEALLAGWLVSILLPRRPFMRFAAIALTLTATSDYLTDSLTPLGYHLAIITALLAIGSGLRYASRGGALWLIAAVISLEISVWTVDVAFILMPFVPVLLFLVPVSRRRVVLLLALCAAATLPAMIREWFFLRDPTSYAAAAIQQLPLRQLSARIARLYLENFKPWRWVFSRPLIGVRPPMIIPMPVQALLALCGAAAFLVRAGARPAEQNESDKPLLLVALFALMALVFNGLYASLTMADVHNRTHLVSRIWVSLAIAIGAGWAAGRWPRARFAVLAALAIFVGFGVWGGLERQDLFLSTWRRHQRELSSILDCVPAFRPGTAIVLRSGNTSHYLATEADYLSSAWLRLLYDPSIRAVRLTPKRPGTCRATLAGLECSREVRFGTKPVHLSYDQLIVLDYDEASGRYHLVPSLTGDALGNGAGGAENAYRPERLIEQRARTRWQREMLLE